MVRDWEELEKKKRQREEEETSSSKRKKTTTTSEKTLAFSSVMSNLHETMKHLTVIANIVKTIEAQRMSAEYIGGTEQVDMDGDDGDDRAEEMITCFRARSRAMVNATEKIRDAVKELRKCVSQNRKFERELVNLQRQWQIVLNEDEDRNEQDFVVTSNTSLAVLAGFGENCNHALSSSKDCQNAMKLRLERDDHGGFKVLIASDAANRIPRNLRLSVVSRKHNKIVCESSLLLKKTSSILQEIHQRVQCFEIFTLARAEALTSSEICSDLSNPVVIRVPILSTAKHEDVLDLVLELIYEKEEEEKEKKMKSVVPSWTANATLDHIQALVLNWRTTRKFSERPLGLGKHASPYTSDPSLNLLKSSVSYTRNIIQAILN
jgi:hypothetical protein